MNKIVNYDWGELKVEVEETPIFDIKNNKFVTVVRSNKNVNNVYNKVLRLVHKEIRKVSWNKKQDSNVDKRE